MKKEKTTETTTETTAITTETTFKNTALNEAYEEILEIENDMRVKTFDIAIILAKVDKEKLYLDDGYKGASDFAQKALDYKKSFAYGLTGVGKKLINTETKQSIFITDSEKDYTASQLFEILPISTESAIELHNNGEISPEMSAKEIREVVKKRKLKDEGKVIEVTAEEKDTTTETETETETKTETATKTDKMLDAIIEYIKANRADIIEVAIYTANNDTESGTRVEQFYPNEEKA